jgi:hypothetical protein
MIARRQPPPPPASPAAPSAPALDRIGARLEELLKAVRATERVRATRGEAGIEKTEEWANEERLRAALLALVDVHVNQLGFGALGSGEPDAAQP